MTNGLMQITLLFGVRDHAPRSFAREATLTGLHSEPVMDFFPLFCQLQHKPVLIVGGTQQAARSARLLLDAKAQVTVNAPQVVPELLALAEQG
ncbi:MAG: precorrin-2 dehydrogenase/sirohydrochlorin ferrochelatase family protein, partial [Aeromonas sp.]